MSDSNDSKDRKYSISVLTDLLEKFKELNAKQFFNLLKWMIRLTKLTINDVSHSKKIRFAKFRQGDIVKVDFGFNVGRELGGVHYAVVLSNNDSQYSATVVVAPLTSIKANSKIKRWEMDLGGEFHETLTYAYEATERDVNRFMMYEEILKKELSSFHDEFKESTCNFKDEQNISKYNGIYLFLVSSGFPKGKADALFCYKDLTEAYSKVKELYQKIFKSNAALKLELSFLKKSSKLKVDQIRCISKFRIINPRNATDALNGAKLSQQTISKIIKQTISSLAIDN